MLSLEFRGAALIDRGTSLGMGYSSKKRTTNVPRSLRLRSVAKEHASLGRVSRQIL